MLVIRVDLTDTLGPALAAMQRRLAAGPSPEVLDRIVDRIHASFQAQFATAGAYAGTPWEPLAESTMRRKPGRSAQILVDTGDLLRSLTERNDPHGIVERASAWSVEVGTDLEYARYHQTGTRNMPARPPAPENLLNQDAEGIRDDLADWMMGRT